LSQLWFDTTHDPWRISCWCLKHCWSPILTLQLSCTFLPLTHHGLRDHTSSSHAVSRATGLRFRRFRKSSDNAVADRFRGWPPRGVHALLAPPLRASCSQMKASASLTLSSSRHFLSAIPFHASAVTRNTVTPPSQITRNRVPLFDSPEPQHHRELLHVLDLTEASSSPQVELTVKAAPPGRHDRRRSSSHVAVPLEPLTAPPLSLALGPVSDADARRVDH